MMTVDLVFFSFTFCMQATVHVHICSQFALKKKTNSALAFVLFFLLLHSMYKKQKSILKLNWRVFMKIPNYNCYTHSHMCAQRKWRSGLCFNQNGCFFLIHSRPAIIGLHFRKCMCVYGGQRWWMQWQVFSLSSRNVYSSSIQWKDNIFAFSGKFWIFQWIWNKFQVSLTQHDGIGQHQYLEWINEFKSFAKKNEFCRFPCRIA